MVIKSKKSFSTINFIFLLLYIYIIKIVDNELKLINRKQNQIINIFKKYIF